MHKVCHGRRLRVEEWCGQADTSELATATGLLLNGRAGYRSVGTKHAAIARLRLEQRFAMGALVEILACIRGHRLLPFMAAAWAAQHGLQNNRAHGLAMSFEGKPACVVA